MPEEVAVRRPTASDRDDLVAMHRALYLDYRRRVLHPELAAASDYRDFERVLEQDVDTMLFEPSRTLLVAERAEGVVGYISGHVRCEPRRILSRRGIIEDWYVIAHARGGGVGRRLLSELTSLFRAMDCEVLESTTWARNEPVRAIHGHLGFGEAMVTYRKRIDDG